MVTRRALSLLILSGFGVLFLLQTPSVFASRGSDVYLQGWGPSSLGRGGSLRVTYTASNVGDQTAQGIFVVIRTPMGTSFSGGDQGCMRQGASVVCYGSSPSGGFDLRPGDRRSFAVTFSVPTTLCGTTLYTSANVQTMRTNDPSASNNSVQVSTRTSCNSSASSFYSSSGYQRFPDHTIVLDDENAVFPQEATRRRIRAASYNGSFTEVSGPWSQMGMSPGQDLLLNTTYWTPRLSRGIYDVYMTWNARDVSTIPTRVKFRIRGSDLETHQLQDQYGAYVYEQRGVEPDGPMWSGRPWEKLGTVRLNDVQNIMVSIEFAGSSALTRWMYAVDGVALVQKR